MLQQDSQEVEQSELDYSLTLDEFTQYFREILQQPKFRLQMNREMDFCDGNQLDSELINKMKERGIPPAVENCIRPAIEAICGQEAKQRTDWRVIPDSSSSDDDEIAEALSEKLRQAERKSRADRGCSDAYYGQISVGIGWLEVSRESDPFKYPYRCVPVGRNEIFWDMKDRSSMLENARWLIRSKWIDRDIAIEMFPDQKDVLNYAMSGFGIGEFGVDGGHSTGLMRAMDAERGFSIEEQEWRDREHKRVRLFEVWTRRWESKLVISTPDGRVVFYDGNNPAHIKAIEHGFEPRWALVSKLYCSWWAGPHKMKESPSPYRHSHFPYVPFWGHREDRTGIPYGRIRGMMYLQEAINATIAKIRWGLSATVITRTKGVVMQKDEQFRKMVARPDADIILDQQEMAKPGSVFKIDRNFELNQQQYQMLADARNAINRAGGVSEEFKGAGSTATSGVQENARIEQSQQSLADLNDNFQESRAQVGELLLSMIIEDMIGKQEDVLIKGNGIKEDKIIRLNEKALSEDGREYLNNDIDRVMLKVVLEDVSSSSSFRTQQLSALSEAYKSASPQAQSVMLPHLLSLTDIPNKKEILDELQKISSQQSPEMLDAQRKMQELEIKARLAEAQIKQFEAQAEKVRMEMMYISMQAGAQAVQIPTVMPISDALMEAAGYVQPSPSGQDPGFSDIDIMQAKEQVLQSRFPSESSNTNPMFPRQASHGMKGIETQRHEII